ncbi:MAG: zinc ribbon domain-containing protein [Dehalococcoidia bacterium]|nr:zinc ribbon domain-containing protein [Dehalococcoidia bacterium]
MAAALGNPAVKRRAMPVYEYRCQQCKRKVSVLFRSFSDTRAPSCQHCGSAQLTRLVSRVTVMKTWGDSVRFPGAEALDGADEGDPAQMTEWMKQMKRELGDPDPKLNELDKLDAGIPLDDAGGDDGTRGDSED